MGLSEVQRDLARLSIEPVLRDRFFADPVAVGAELGLDSHEALGLAGIPRRQVEQFADSLWRKRRDQARRAVPIAARALGGEFAAIFQRYVDESRPRGSKADLDAAAGLTKSRMVISTGVIGKCSTLFGIIRLHISTSSGSRSFRPSIRWPKPPWRYINGFPERWPRGLETESSEASLLSRPTFIQPKFPHRPRSVARRLRLPLYEALASAYIGTSWVVVCAARVSARSGPLHFWAAARQSAPIPPLSGQIGWLHEPPRPDRRAATAPEASRAGTYSSVPSSPSPRRSHVLGTGETSTTKITKTTKT